MFLNEHVFITPDWLQPARVEFFDDEVESIRLFDVATQRSLDRLAEVELTMLPVGRSPAPSPDFSSDERVHSARTPASLLLLYAR